MEKVLVDIFVPVLNRTFEVFIPLRSPMHEVLELIKKAVTELSDGRMTVDENTTLCYRTDGTIININLSVYELGIKNGSKLMLI
ncbi:MAG: methyltransferase [Lachnospiraceae bacterium]|nr:methyltransferase [Lachnospiraceae bacterium]